MRILILSQHSWDWGPAFPSMGIWKPMTLDFFDGARIRYVKWTPTLTAAVWNCQVEAILEKSPDRALPISGILTVRLTEAQIFQEFPCTLTQDPGNSRPVVLGQDHGQFCCRKPC